VGTSLLLQYVERGRVAAVERLLADVRSKDVACWNAMLEGYVSNGHGYDAMRTEVTMCRRRVPFNPFTYVSALGRSTAERGFFFCSFLNKKLEMNYFQDPAFFELPRSD
jgi:hypothetical protein